MRTDLQKREELATRPARRRWQPPTNETLFMLTLVLFGFRAGAHAIADNSMLLHLRTGIDMVRGAGIPRHDIYSYTARGHEWVVQSWLAEWTYGWAYKLWDLRLVILEQAVLTALLAWLSIRLVRTGAPLRTALGGIAVVGFGVAFWSQRPLLFGLLCLVLMVTVVEERRSPWLLLPIMWVWVNSHGSFPLGVLWLGAVGVGSWIDRRSFPRDLLPYVAGLVGGLAVACINPLGPKLLTFALTVGQKREVFKTIIEWASPNFQDFTGLFSLVFLVLGLVILLRARPAWRDVIPVVGFLALGLIAVRNLPMAAIVMAPAIGRALRPAPAASGPASLEPERRPPLNLAILGVLALAVLIFAASAVSGRSLDLSSYPVALTSRLDRAGLLQAPHRLAHQDLVGNYLALRDGRRARVFVDDRYDMYPVRSANDYAELLRGGPRSLSILKRYDVDVVLWDRDQPLVPLLRATGDWRQLGKADKKGYIALVRR